MFGLFLGCLWFCLMSHQPKGLGNLLHCPGFLHLESSVQNEPEMSVELCRALRGH